MEHIILGLGSNLGNCKENLSNACDALHRIIQNITYSPIYQSQALLPENAPKKWDIDYLNMVISGHTQLSAETLLQEIKTIEKTLGRTPAAIWAPRVIDIDILAYGESIIESDTLTIPHSALAKRDFVLKPLRDILPHWHHPKTKASIDSLIAGLPPSSNPSTKAT